MDVREALYAKAALELRLSSRKLGFGALGLAAL